MCNLSFPCKQPPHRCESYCNPAHHKMRRRSFFDFICRLKMHIKLQCSQQRLISRLNEKKTLFHITTKTWGLIPPSKLNSRQRNTLNQPATFCLCSIDISTNAHRITAARSTDSHWDLLLSTTGDDCTPTRHPCSLSEPRAFINTHSHTHTSVHCYCAEPHSPLQTRSLKFKIIFPCRFNAAPDKKALKSLGDKMQPEYHQGLYLTALEGCSSYGLWMLWPQQPAGLVISSTEKKGISAATWDKPVFTLSVHRSTHITQHGPTLFSFGIKRLPKQITVL